MQPSQYNTRIIQIYCNEYKNVYKLSNTNDRSEITKTKCTKVNKLHQINKYNCPNTCEHTEMSALIFPDS